MAKDLTRKVDPQADAQSLLTSLGVAVEDVGTYEQTGTGGITKWIDLAQFQVDPTVEQKPVKGNGKAFAGVLISRSEMEVEDTEPGEANDRGVRVRHFYNIKLLAQCPVTFKDEDKADVKEVAQIGDIVCIGERHALKSWRELTEGGGLYAVVVRPHSRIRIGGGRTMWTFDLWQKCIRQPMKVRAEIVQKAPF